MHMCINVWTTEEILNVFFNLSEQISVQGTVFVLQKWKWYVHAKAVLEIKVQF
jgi:hypothetical protein